MRQRFKQAGLIHPRRERETRMFLIEHKFEMASMTPVRDSLTGRFVGAFVEDVGLARGATPCHEILDMIFRECAATPKGSSG